MELFKSGLKSVLGTQQPGQQLTGAETVERLIERIQSSTLLEDRRDAVRAIKSLSRKFRLDVGAQGMDALVKVLEMDRSDSEIISYALESLCNVMTSQGGYGDEGEEVAYPNDDDLGSQFTEIFTKKAENVALLLSMLEEDNFKVRLSSVRLLMALVNHHPKELQEAILVSPMGVSKLMDLLVDSREVIRNDGLLLLIHLTKGSANIQKIVAFENAFDRVLDIVQEEGYSDGGIVVEDCLCLLLNLIKNNTSNQNFFKEGSFIQRLTPFFYMGPTENGYPDCVRNSDDEGLPAEGFIWSTQKINNVQLCLQVLRTLVSPNNPQQVTTSSQKVMNSCGLLGYLCTILMSSGVPADILTETINTVSEVIRGHHQNQEYFAGIQAPCNPPRPAIVVLLMSMVNEKQPFSLRSAVLYCFQCFLYKNELGQAQVVQTLLPSQSDNNAVTAGQLLCAGLFSNDSLSNWFAAVAMSHALINNTAQREQLLRVQLATSVGNPPVTLLQQCSLLLQQSNKEQTRLGLLLLLITWLSGSNVAVNHYLSIATNVPFLTVQVGASEGGGDDNDESLVQGLCAFLLGLCVEYNDNTVSSCSQKSLLELIERRIGLETYLTKLGLVSKHEKYTLAAQRPQHKYQGREDVAFDYEFCRLFKSLESVVCQAVHPKPELNGSINGLDSNLSDSQHALLQQYKDLIRDQDQQLTDYRRQLEEIRTDHGRVTAQLQDYESSLQQLRDQNSLLKACRNGASPLVVPVPEADTKSQQELARVKSELELVRGERDELRSRLAMIESTPKSQSLQSESPFGLDVFDTIAQIESMRQSLSEKEAEISQLRCRVSETPSPERGSGLVGESRELAEQNRQLFERLQQVENDLKVANELKQLAENEKSILRTDFETTQKEQEDLLVLLTDQDTKLSRLRDKLQLLGVKVDDDDDLGCDLDDEDSGKLE